MNIVRTRRLLIIPMILLGMQELAEADETFVKIQQVSGNRVLLVKDSGDRGGGRRGGQQAAQGGRGRMSRFGRGGASSNAPVTVVVPSDAKITSAMRERRTFEFRVGVELAGGLRHRIFDNLREPLSARVVTDNNRIKEINVILPQTDVNVMNTTSEGETVIAIRPKRPPSK